MEAAVTVYYLDANSAHVLEFEQLENEYAQDVQNEFIKDASSANYSDTNDCDILEFEPIENECIQDIQNEFIKDGSSANYSDTSECDVPKFQQIGHECIQDIQNESIKDASSVNYSDMLEFVPNDSDMIEFDPKENEFIQDSIQDESIKDANSTNDSSDHEKNLSTPDNIENSDDIEDLEEILGLENRLDKIEMIRLSNNLDQDVGATNDGNDHSDCELGSSSNGINVRVSSQTDLSQEHVSSVPSSAFSMSPAILKDKMVSFNDASHHSIDSGISEVYLSKVNDFQTDSDLPQEVLRANSSYNKYLLSPNLFRANENSRSVSNDSKMCNNRTNHFEESTLSDDELINHQSRKRKRIRVLDSDDDSDKDNKADNFEKKESDSEDSDIDEFNDLNPIKKKKNNSYECKVNKSISDDDFLKNLYVPESSEGGKHYKKEACCPYCFGVFMRLDQHLLNKHPEKETMKRIKALPKGSKERRREFSKLRSHGNDRHNTDPAINKKKKLLVKRRLAINRGIKKGVSNDEKDLSDFESGIESDEENLINKMKSFDLDSLEKEKSKSDMRPVKLERIKCNLCPEYVSRRNISNHYKNWHATDAEKDSNTRAILKNCRRENEIVHPLACERVKKEIISSLRVNETFDLIRFDKTIIIYLNHICDRYDIKDQNKLIRTNARTLGEYLKTMIKLNPTIKSLESCMSAEHWENTVKAVRIIAKFDYQKRTFGSPSTAQLLGLILKTVVSVLKSYHNRNHDRSGFRMVKSFEVEFEAHWTNSVGSKIVSSQNIIKRHDLGKTITAMSTADKNILIEFLDSRRHVLFKQLQKNFSQNTYDELMKCEMIYIQSANGRRPCEIDRATLEDYGSKKHASPENEHSRKLDPKEQLRLKDYIFMETKGKKLHGLDGRIYLKQVDIKILDHLINSRRQTNITNDNPHLFAQGEHHFDAHETMRKLVDICHLKYKAFENRDSVTATGLRKYAATKYKSSTNGNYSEFLMRHLAHTKKTHDAHYRAITAQETAIVTNILESIILSKESIDEHNNEDVHNNQDENNTKETSFEAVAESDDSHNAISQEKTSKSTVAQQKPRKGWRSEDIAAFELAFVDEIKEKRYASRNKIRSAMEQFSVLKSRGENCITARFQQLKKKWTAL